MIISLLGCVTIFQNKRSFSNQAADSHEPYCITHRFWLERWLCWNSQRGDLDHCTGCDGQRSDSRYLPPGYFSGCAGAWPGRAVFSTGRHFFGVVDPGVGTARRPIAARFGGQYFVGPDNGLFTLLLDEAERRGHEVEIIHLNRPQYWLPKVSNIFHGRDIFAPVAAHLAQGVPLARLGEAITNPVRLQLPVPIRSQVGWQGEVTHIDAFGNLATNLRSEHLQGRGQIEVRTAEMIIRGMVRSFGEGLPGQFVALIDSSGALSICQVNGNAERSLQIGLGALVQVVFVT
jgi:S-adenosylmethionine hydrolase